MTCGPHPQKQKQVFAEAARRCDRKLTCFTSSHLPVIYDSSVGHNPQRKGRFPDGERPGGGHGQLHADRYLLHLSRGQRLKCNGRQCNSYREGREVSKRHSPCSKSRHCNNQHRTKLQSKGFYYVPKLICLFLPQMLSTPTFVYPVSHPLLSIGTCCHTAASSVGPDLVYLRSAVPQVEVRVEPVHCNGQGGCHLLCPHSGGKGDRANDT